MLEGNETRSFVKFNQVVACLQIGNLTIQVVLKCLFLHNKGLTEVFEKGFYFSPEVASNAMTVNPRIKERVCKESA